MQYLGDRGYFGCYRHYHIIHWALLGVVVTYLTPDDRVFLKVNGIKDDFPEPTPFSHRTSVVAHKDLSSALGRIVWRSEDRRKHLGMRRSSRILDWDGLFE